MNNLVLKLTRSIDNNHYNDKDVFYHVFMDSFHHDSTRPLTAAKTRLQFSSMVF